MKGYLVIGLLIVFFLGGVSASEPPQPVTCSDSNQTILRLESYINAHGEVWNGTTGYPYEICFDSFFGNIWTGANPHACTGNNLVLNLDQQTDASVDGPGAGGTFTVPVCYGDLSCELQRSIDSCENLGGARGAPIVSLSAQTDGHLAEGSRYESTTEDLILCCYSAIPPICNYDGFCDDVAGETQENCPDCVTGPICDLDGRRLGHEECDCGPGGVNEICEPVQLGGETCGSQLGAGWQGELRCNTACGFDTGACTQGPPTDTFCTDYDANFWWDDGGTPRRVEHCNEVNDMNDKNNYSGSIEAFREEACNKCSTLNQWEYPIDPAADSQNCVWSGPVSTGSCVLEKTYAGDLICQQEWTDETACDENGFRNVTIVHTKVSGDGTCPADDTVNIACSGVIQLPFLSTGGIVAIIILIALIYFIYLKKKKRK